MKRSPNVTSGIEIAFRDQEVVTIRRVFEEEVARLRSLGNDGSISKYQEWVATWEGNNQTYKAPRVSNLTEPLQHFVDATEDKVDGFLDTSPSDTRIRDAGERYRLGYRACAILIELEQTDAGEAIVSGSAN